MKAKLKETRQESNHQHLSTKKPDSSTGPTLYEPCTAIHLSLIYDQVEKVGGFCTHFVSRISSCLILFTQFSFTSKFVVTICLHLFCFVVFCFALSLIPDFSSCSLLNLSERRFCSYTRLPWLWFMALFRIPGKPGCALRLFTLQPQ